MTGHYDCKRCHAHPLYCKCKEDDAMTKGQEETRPFQQAQPNDGPDNRTIAQVIGKHPEKPDLTKDSGDSFIQILDLIADEDVLGLKKAKESYGNSWKLRGGVGAFMMLARKWDRFEPQLKKPEINYDIFKAIATDQRPEGIIDDVRDLRRYLLLVEAEMRARGFDATHRDNK